MSFTKQLIVPLATVLVSVFCGCRAAPITGRSQLLMMPEQRELGMGTQAYQDVVTKEKPSSNKDYVDLVNRVGNRIAAVSGRPDYQWEFRVLESSQQNAFCLPGGKVAVYEGILPICDNEAGLAVVMSHEIGHALARHGGERISQGYVVEGVRQVVAYVTQTQEQQQKDLIMRAYGAASEYGVILPYSRKHETEADHIGLMLMAKAGYDPQEAPRFWNRFSQSHTGPRPPEFASTHPNDEKRAYELSQLLPQAQQYYDAAPDKIGLGSRIPLAGGAGSLAQQPSVAPPPVSPPNGLPATGTPMGTNANVPATNTFVPAKSLIR